MKGRILDYSMQTHSGLISAEDGRRYVFSGAEWWGEGVPARGMGVDFDVEGEQARAVYLAFDYGAPPVGGYQPYAKSKVAAGLLAIFLGTFGIHKFYLGYTGAGLVYLLTNTIGWVVTAFLLGIPNIVLGVMAFVEGILYLTKTDEEFNQMYVVNKRPWF